MAEQLPLTSQTDECAVAHFLKTRELSQEVKKMNIGQLEELVESITEPELEELRKQIYRRIRNLKYG